MISLDYDIFEGHKHNVGEEFTISLKLSQQIKGEGKEEEYVGPVHIDIDIYQLPPSYFTRYRKSGRGRSHFIRLVTHSPHTIDAADESVINVTMMVLPNYPGKWGIGISLNKVHSSPILFTTNMPVTQLLITKQPTTGDIIIVRDIGRILPTVYIYYIYIYIYNIYIYMLYIV